MTRSKKIISAAMAMCLAVSMTPMINGAAYADDLQAIDFTEQELSNFEPNSSLTEKDLAGITYDSKTKTITLNNVNLTKSLGGNDWFEISDTNATIKLIGSNKFTNKNGVDESCLFNCMGDVTITGSGSLTVSGMNCVQAENINIKSGTFNVNAPEACLSAENKINVASGAKLSLVTKKKNTKYSVSNAVFAEKMTNSCKSLVKVVGGMPTGAEIKDKNAVYKVLNDDNYVKLTKWISGKSAKFTGDYEKSIMGCYYRIYSIGSNAFNNSAGKKLKKLTIKPSGVNSIKIEKYAFKGTKSLTDIYTCIGSPSKKDSIIVGDYSIMSGSLGPKKFITTRNWGGDKYSKSKTVNKLAFAGAGKSNGKKLTVHIYNHYKVKYAGKLRKVSISYDVSGYHGSSYSEAASYGKKKTPNIFKKILPKCGFSKNIKVVIPNSAYKAEQF